MPELILRGLLLRPMRTCMTGAALTTAFLLFALMTPVLNLFQQAESARAGERLVIQPRHSIADFLPVRHAAEAAGLDSVAAVTHRTWFGGVFRAPESQFARWAVPPESFLALHPEIELDPQQRAAFLQTRDGAIVGRHTAQRFGLSVGDQIRISPDIWSTSDGADWLLRVVGIYSSAHRSDDETSLYLNYSYFDEYRNWGRGQVSVLVARVAPGHEPERVAAQIDTLLSRGPDSTRTSSETAWLASFLNQLGDIRLIVSSILSAAFFTILLLTVSTMSQSIRERRRHLAVLRAIGFPPASVVAILAAEGMVLAGSAALLGGGIAAATVEFGRSAVPQLGTLAMGPEVAVQLGLIAAVIAIISGALPAISVLRAPLVDSIRTA